MPEKPRIPASTPQRDEDRTRLTLLLADASAGDAHAAGRAMPLVYSELLDLARRQMRRAGTGHTLQPTALVHEAWMRIAGSGGALRDRAHFWALAATAMRQILVDYARRKRRLKRGGERGRVDLDAVEIPLEPENLDLVALDEALMKLTALEPRLARTVELRYFGGLSVEHTAEVMDVGSATVKRDWALARAWLRRELSDEPSERDR